LDSTDDLTPAIDAKPKPAPFKIGILLTILAWLISRFAITATWGPARNPFKLAIDQWARWDTLNYLAITSKGRTFGLCHLPPFSSSSNPLAFKWCGTAGWLPGYPYVIRALQSVGIGSPQGGLLIAWVATAGALFLVWFGWGRDLPCWRAFLMLLLVGLFPGSVYNFAIFPTSLALLAIIAALLMATRERFLLTALFMTVAGLCYPSAWFAGIGLAIGMILVGYKQGTSMAVRRGLWGLAGLSSIAFLLIHDYLAFDGKATAFFLVDSQPGLVATGFPGQEFLRLIFTRNSIEQRPLGTFGASVLAVQGALTVLLTVWATVRAALGWRRGNRSPSSVYPALVGLAVMLSVLLHGATGGAWNRSIVLAAPCVVCLRGMRTGWLIGTLIVVGVTTALISRYFFVGTLV
jgi:hypothetical protein